MKFRIKIPAIYLAVFIVEANSRNEAIELVARGGAIDYKLESTPHFATDTDNWSVEKVIEEE